MSKPENPIFEFLIGESLQMKTVFRIVERMAAVDTPVLITGESGTGKELIARAIHFHSDRRLKPLVAVNCAALPEYLFESEMFGHEEGAVKSTTATQRKVGRWEMAHGGTLILDAIDSIGGLKPEIQAKLARALQGGMFVRLGSSDEITVDVRVIAIWTSTCDLETTVRAGKLLPDLFDPLKVPAVHLPPLRERREDIPLLLDHFLRLNAQHYSIAPKTLSPEVVNFLTSYHWPGNVRQLEVLVAHVTRFTPHETITLHDLPAGMCASDRDQLIRECDKLIPVYDKEERKIIRKVLKAEGFDRDKAAYALGVPRKVLDRLMQKHKLSRKKNNDDRDSLTGRAHCKPILCR